MQTSTTSTPGTPDTHGKQEHKIVPAQQQKIIVVVALH